MGIIPTICIFLAVTWANVINTKYLISANDGLKKRNLQIRNGLKKRNLQIRNGLVIENDYANLMYQVAASGFCEE